MMRKLLVLGAVIVALLSLGTVAQGQTNDHGHVWFFGDCENPYVETGSTTSNSLFFGGGCRGIGIFAGMWDNESIAEHVAYEAMEEFGGDWEVDYLKAINLFGGPPVTGAAYGCGSQVPISVTPQTFGGGLWIAIFSVVPCEPEVCVPPIETLLAVAYIDNNESDGGYQPCVDTLIAKLVDQDLSGTVNAGDFVVTDRYPKDFAAAAVGSFTVGLHTVAAVTEATSTQVWVENAGGDLFLWTDVATLERYQEAVAGGDPTSLFRDSFNSASVADTVLVEGLSPSVPDDDVAQINGSDSSDQGFVDVEIFVIDLCSADITTAC